MPPLAEPGAPFVMLVQNLVFTGDVGTSLRLDHVLRAMAHRGAELNPRRFSAVVIRAHMNAGIAEENLLGDLGPKTVQLSEAAKWCGETGPFLPPAMTDVRQQELRPTVLCRKRLARIAMLLFRTGNVVCTGGRTLAQARYVLASVAATLRSIGYPDARIVRMNIRNMVGCAQLPCRINRERLAREIPEYATFDKEQFPGVTLKNHPLTKPMTLLIFDSGRVVVTGTRSKACADAALARILPLLVHFSVDTPEGTPMPNIVPDDYAPLDVRAPWPEMVASRVAYDAFGVPPDASLRDIERRWRVRMREVHPDKNPDIIEGTPDHNVLLSETHYVNDLYDLLRDPAKRSHYNRTGLGLPAPPAQRWTRQGATVHSAEDATAVDDASATAVIPPLPDSDIETDDDSNDAEAVETLIADILTEPGNVSEDDE